MPSLPHTVLLELLRRAPPLVATLLREGCAAPLPRFSAAQVVEGEFADTEPAEVRADLVLALTDKGGRPALAIVVEAQLRRDPTKRWVWPVYLASLTVLDSARRPLYTDLVRFFLGAAARAELGVDAMQPLSDEELLRPFLYLYRRSIFGQLMAPLHRARREARQAKTDGELAGLHEALLAILDARSIALTATQRRTITDCRQRAQLLRWVQRAATVDSARELFAARRATKRPVARR